MSTDLAGRTAIVTGAASGIGLACAEAFAEAGANLVLLDRDESVHDAAAKLNGRARIVDLSDREAILALELDADILVNVAGVQHVSLVEDFPPEKFALMLALMLEAPFLLSRAVLPGMYERGWGRLIHLSSVHGLRASAYKSAYVSSDAAAFQNGSAMVLDGGWSAR